MIPAASIPTTEDNETDAQKEKKTQQNSKYVPSHKFTAFSKQQSDLDTNLAPDPHCDRFPVPPQATAELILWIQVTTRRLQMADAFRARHPDLDAKTHIRRDDQSRIDHVLCSHDDFKLIRGIAKDADNKIPNTAHRTLILDLDKKNSSKPKKITTQTKQLPHHQRFHQEEWEALWEIQKQHKEEWSKLMASAIDPTLIIDEKNPEP